VLVTGGTGFIGRAIVERLLGEGANVRALARSDSSAGALADLGAEPVRGDVLDPESLTAAMQGRALVYHAAGANAFCLRDPSPLFEVNVRGSENVVRAAAQAEVGRIVYTSSAATLGERKGTVGSEQSLHRGRFLSDYERSKFEAECAVLAAADETGVELVCVNPASVQGPGRATGSTQLLLDYLNGRLKAVVDTTLSLIDIVDCTTGHLLAASIGRPGERYVLSGATLTVREGLELLGRLSGVEQPVRALPPWLAMTVATVVETVARLRRLEGRARARIALHPDRGHASPDDRLVGRAGPRPRLGPA
jgi:dihydroflavonol-4-reductase